jgi:hypothetical protein
MSFLLLTAHLLETAQAGSAPLWVILMIVTLVLALFVWGMVNSSGALGQPNSTAASHGDHDAHHGDHH